MLSCLLAFFPLPPSLPLSLLENAKLMVLDMRQYTNKRRMSHKKWMEKKKWKKRATVEKKREKQKQNRKNPTQSSRYLLLAYPFVACIQEQASKQTNAKLLLFVLLAAPRCSRKSNKQSHQNPSWLTWMKRLNIHGWLSRDSFFPFFLSSFLFLFFVNGSQRK